MERHPAVPGATRWKYLVRLAAGQGDQALLARPERAGGLHLAEGTYQRHQLQHQLRHALAAAHQRRVQQVAGQADFRLQRPAGVDYCVQLHDTQGAVEFSRQGRRCPGWPRLDHRRSAPLSERANHCKRRSRRTISSRTWRGDRGTIRRCGAAATRSWIGCPDSLCSW